MIYLYDGTYDGFLSAIFEAFARRENPEDILAQKPEQMDFFQAFTAIPTHAAHARRVEAGIIRAMNADILSYVFAAMHSVQPGAGRTLLLFLRAGFREGAAILEHLTDDNVIHVMRLSRQVWSEAGRWKEFLRFYELENGIFIAQYEPENDVTELLMPHFADRFGTHPFMIHDRGRKKAGICQNGSWMIASSERMALPQESREEAYYQKLWLLFYDTVAIQARENPKLRRQMMPKKYWKDMLEMNRRPGTPHRGE